METVCPRTKRGLAEPVFSWGKSINTNIII